MFPECPMLQQKWKQQEYNTNHAAAADDDDNRTRGLDTANTEARHWK
jgi:hypothetical protein